MSRRIFPLLFLTLAFATPAHAQKEGWVWRQLSEWQPDGSPVIRPAVAETSFVVTSPVRDARTRRLKEVTIMALAGEMPTPTSFTIVLGRDGRVATMHTEEGDEFLAAIDLENPLGSLLLESRAFLVPAALRGDSLVDDTRARQVVPARVSSILDDSIGGDTITLARHRSGRVVERLRREGRTWLRLRATGDDTLTAIRFIENSFERTRVEVKLAGPVEESYLLEPATGRVDSLRQDLHWTGTLRFTGPRGPVVTVRGRWHAERTAAWEANQRPDAEAAMGYFMVHGRYPPADSIRPPTAEEELVTRAFRGDTTTLDSALARRDAATTLAGRINGDQLVGQVTAILYRQRRGDLGEHAPFARLEATDPLTPRLLPSYASETWLGAGAARRLTTIFATLETQRRLGVDREEAFAALTEMVMDPDSITPEAADVFVEGARRADDPSARDLFLLGAYRGRPARYLALAESLPPYGGYRRILWRVTRGDFSLGGETWGVGEDSDSSRKADPQPGLDEPWQAHASRARSRPSFAPPGWFGEWLAAHEPDGHARLRERFRTESSPEGRLVWAQYLLLLNDTTPVSWIQQAALDADSAAAEAAYRAMSRWEWQARFADTLRAGPELAELQDLLLRHTRGEALITASGDTAFAFSPHDETPGEHLLILDGLDPSIAASPWWRDRFEFVDERTLQARADSSGLVMALTIRPVLRYGRYFETGVDLRPYGPPGTMCLCGGGTSVTLVRHNGRWVIIATGSWIS